MSHTSADKLILALGKDLSEDEFALAMMKGEIAGEIALRRVELGMNQTQFAKYMGVTQGLVSRWENGEVNFTLSTLISIASRLGIEMQPVFKPRPAPVYGRPKDNVISFEEARYSRVNSATAPSHYRDALEM